MKISKLFYSRNFYNNMVLKTLEGEYRTFTIAPFRTITDSDLHPIEAYPENGDYAEEAPEYLYHLYGFER